MNAFRAPANRARLALAAGVVALLLAAVLPPLAWVPGLAAVILGADARQRDRSAGRGDAMAFAGMALGALAIAIGIALVVSAAGA